VDDRGRALAREERWSKPTAIATFGAIALLVASFFLISSLSGENEAATLREIHDGSGVIVASAVQGIGFALLAAPLLYLFQAALLRSGKMRSQFRALVLLAPLALAIASVLNGVAAKEAASDFTAGKSRPSLSVKEASRECRSEQKEDASGFEGEFGKGAEASSRCVAEKREADAATNAIDGAGLHGMTKFVQGIGVLALIFSFVYCSLHALRTGLLTRFWGALGIALGVAILLGLLPVALIWFAYLGLLFAGWLPGGRPPAWAAGEAIPWPSPGEKAASELEKPEDPTE
jgi:hypothetical protein